jgi:hypothetical protein
MPLTPLNVMLPLVSFGQSPMIMGTCGSVTEPAGGGVVVPVMPPAGGGMVISPPGGGVVDPPGGGVVFPPGGVVICCEGGVVTGGSVFVPVVVVAPPVTGGVGEVGRPVIAGDPAVPAALPATAEGLPTVTGVPPPLIEVAPPDSPGLQAPNGRINKRIERALHVIVISTDARSASASRRFDVSRRGLTSHPQVWNRCDKPQGDRNL